MKCICGDRARWWVGREEPYCLGCAEAILWAAAQEGGGIWFSELVPRETVT